MRWRLLVLVIGLCLAAAPARADDDAELAGWKQRLEQAEAEVVSAREQAAAAHAAYVSMRHDRSMRGEEKAKIIAARAESEHAVERRAGASRQPAGGGAPRRGAARLGAARPARRGRAPSPDQFGQIGFVVDVGGDVPLAQARLHDREDLVALPHHLRVAGHHLALGPREERLDDDRLAAGRLRDLDRRRVLVGAVERQRGRRARAAPQRAAAPRRTTGCAFTARRCARRCVSRSE